MPFFFVNDVDLRSTWHPSLVIASSMRRPRDAIRCWRDLAKGAADSRNIFPRPDLGCQTYLSGSNGKTKRYGVD